MPELLQCTGEAGGPMRWLDILSNSHESGIMHESWGDHGNRVRLRFETKVIPFFSRLLTSLTRCSTGSVQDLDDALEARDAARVSRYPPFGRRSSGGGSFGQVWPGINYRATVQLIPP
jgi:hypothetical protein